MRIFFFLILFPCLGLAAFEPKRTSFGDPDLQGIWNNTSMTTLERIKGANSLVLTPAEASILENAQKKLWDTNNNPIDPVTGLPPKSDHTGGYDYQVWFDLGSRLGKVNGEIRSSWITDPPSGKIPYSAEGLKQRHIAGRGQADNFDGNDHFEGPEMRPHSDRCLGFNAGPPILNTVYNNNFQIVQSPGFVVIVAEMAHDARIVRLGGKHLPNHIRPWYGDSIGHWEKNTLVVETTNLNPQQTFSTDPRFSIFLGLNSVVTERFTRVGTDEILYQFQVDDPKIYTQSWRGELPMYLTKGPIYEYACHEGNSSMTNMLAGARAREKKGKAKK